MEDIELIQLWEASNKKLEEARLLNLQSWALNLQWFESLQTQKARSRLRSLARFKIAAIVSGILWIALLTVLFLHSLTFSKIFFAGSVVLIIGFNVLAILVYMRQIFLIRQINNSGSIVDTQEKLAILQTSTLRITRILFLQMPFFTSFFFTPAWIMSGDPRFWGIAFPVTIGFTLLSLWLYRNISLKNAHKKWFRVLFGSIEWTSIMQAREFLGEVENFKKELVMGP